MLRRAASQINCEATSRESIGKIKRARFFVHAGIPLKSPPLRIHPYSPRPRAGHRAAWVRVSSAWFAILRASASEPSL
jgi:hypothetical protein